MKSDTPTLIAALREIGHNGLQTPEGLIEQVILEAADRIEELAALRAKPLQWRASPNGDPHAGAMGLDYTIRETRTAGQPRFTAYCNWHPITKDLRKIQSAKAAAEAHWQAAWLAARSPEGETA